MREEALGEAQNAELQAFLHLDHAAVGEAELDAAAADVDERRPPLTQVEGVRHREVDEAGLLAAGDQIDVNAELAADLGDEVAAVLCLADGAGRDGDDAVRLLRISETLEGRERLHPGLHRVT